MGDELLRPEAVQLLALAYLAHLMRAGAEDGVVVIERIGVIGHVCADQGVEHVDVVHRMNGASQLEVVEIEQLGHEDVALEELEEPSAPETSADAEGADRWRPLMQAGVRRIGRHIADRLAQLAGQVSDDVTPVVPVLATLCIEDDPSLPAGQTSEGAVLAPATEERPGPGRARHSCATTGFALGGWRYGPRLPAHRQAPSHPDAAAPHGGKTLAAGTSRS